MNESFGNLKGATLRSIVVSPDKTELTLETDTGIEYIMRHEQDCCEGVSIDDICGNLEDLLHTPILLAEESTNEGGMEPPGMHKGGEESSTWTFYRLRTSKGSVTIRWYGSSNGYYSESVTFEKVRT